MATVNWNVTVGATSFTSITQSLLFSVGRASYFDTWSGGTCTFTVRNNTGQAANIAQGDLITIGNDLSTVDLYFYVVEVTFQDDIAANANTATITGRDAIGQILQFPISGEPGIYTNALDQIAALMDQLAPFNPPYPDPSPVAGRAIVETTFGETTIGQRIVDLLLTENSTYYFDGQTVVYRSSSAPGTVTWTYGPNDIAGSVIYDSLVRKYPNANYPNNVRLTSTTVGTTTGFVTGTYRRNYDRSVLLTGTTQQTDQTNYYANTLSDDSQLYLDIRIIDSANTSAKMTSVLDDLSVIVGKRVEVDYTPPGGGVTYAYQVVEGVNVNVVPGQTSLTFRMSPQTIYDLFTLDSTTFGILGGTIVYDSPIQYNDPGETYDSATTDNGNRLGW